MTESIPKELLEQGYRVWEDDDPFENHVGPFLFKDNGDGSYQSAFVASGAHVNSAGSLHGGLLMTFADYSLFAIARDHLGDACVTIAFNSEFVAGAGAGDLIEASGEVVRNTRSLIFVSGKIFCDDRTLMNFSGILKKVKA